MKLIAFFIKRPVSSLVLSIAIIFWGIISFFDLPLRALPVVDIPVITVTTQFPGTSPQVMEAFISSPLEDALSSIEGVDYIESNNKQGQSTITITLVDGTDSDKALTNISANISSVKWKMPKDALNSVIEKKGSSSPVVWFGFSSKKLKIQDITNYLNLVAMPKFESVDGVKNAMIFGGHNYAMRIWLNPRKMASYGLTANEIVEKI